MEGLTATQSSSSSSSDSFSATVAKLINDLSPLTDPFTVLVNPTNEDRNNCGGLNTQAKSAKHFLEGTQTQGGNLSLGSQFTSWREEKRQIELLVEQLPAQEQQLLVDLLLVKREDQCRLLELIQRVVHKQQLMAAGAAANNNLMTSAPGGLGYGEAHPSRFFEAVTDKSRSDAVEHKAPRSQCHEDDATCAFAGDASTFPIPQVQDVSPQKCCHICDGNVSERGKNRRNQRLADHVLVQKLAETSQARTTRQQLVTQDELLSRKQLESRLHALICQLSSRYQRQTPAPTAHHHEIANNAPKTGEDARSPVVWPSPFRPAYFPYLAGTIAQRRMQLPSARIGNFNDGNDTKNPDTPSVAPMEEEDSVIVGALNAADASLRKEKEETAVVTTAVSSFFQSLGLHEETKLAAAKPILLSTPVGQRLGREILEDKQSEVNTSSCSLA